MQNELKQISLCWTSIFSVSESEYVEYNKQSDFLSSQRSPLFRSPCTMHRVSNEDDWGRVSCDRQFHIGMPIETVVLCHTKAAYNYPFLFSSIRFETEALMTYTNEKCGIL